MVECLLSITECFGYVFWLVLELATVGEFLFHQFRAGETEIVGYGLAVSLNLSPKLFVCGS